VVRVERLLPLAGPGPVDLEEVMAETLRQQNQLHKLIQVLEVVV
jgi:hypothetical protein